MATTMNPLSEPKTEADRAETMTAIVQHRYGGPEVLSLGEIAVPSPGTGEVLIEVEAAGIDRGTWHLMTGLPYLTRLLFGLRRPKRPVPGLDVAGTVIAIGDGVDRLAVGDRVFGLAAGSLAPYAVATADKLALLPDGIAWEQGAAAGVSGSTALQALDTAGVTAGDRVLVLGAAGGVGSFAVQLAAARGAVVTGVASAAKGDLVRSLGADEVLAYDVPGVLTLDRGRWDVIIDTGGRRPLRELRRALTEVGTLMLVGGEDGNRWTGGFERSVFGALLSPLVSQRLVMFLSEEHHRHLDPVAEAMAAGSVRSSIGARYALADTSRALADLEAGRIRGKAVVEVRPAETDSPETSTAVATEAGGH